MEFIFLAAVGAWAIYQFATIKRKSKSAHKEYFERMARRPKSAFH